MKKILLPTDFSENAWNAISYAMQLFKDETCTFYVLNAYEYVMNPPSSGVLSVSQNNAVVQAQKENSERDLANTLNKIHKEFKNTKHAFETYSMYSTFTDAVEKSIEKFKINMIVMGTTGTNAVKEMTFGSNTAALVGKITCPILAIPKDVTFKPLKEIGIACDYEYFYTKKLLKPFLELVDQQKSNISVLHVLNDKDDLSDDQFQIQQNLKKILPARKTEFYTLTNIKVPLAIHAFTEIRKLDLICILAKKHSIIERLLGKAHSKSISKHAEIPLLVLHCSNC